MRRKGKREAKKRIKASDLAKLIPTAVLVTALLSGSVWWYNNHLVAPRLNFTSTDTQDRFTVAEEYRGVSVSLHPQLIVRYRTSVILIAALDGYYRNAYISLDGKSGYAEKTNQKYLEEIMAHIREGVLQELTALRGEEEAQAVFGELLVYTSVLGGVQYENRRGNSVKTYCFIEEGGLLLDYAPDEEVIARRLNEVEIDLEDHSGTSGDSIKQMITISADQINAELEPHSSGVGPLLEILSVGKLIAPLVILVFPGPKGHPRRRLWLRRGAVAVIIMGTVTFSAKALTVTRDEKLTYRTTEITSQRSVDTLFAPPTPEPFSGEEIWPAYLDRLHITEKFVGEDISQRLLDYYEISVFEPLYKNGGADRPDGPILPSWISLDSGPYIAIDDEIMASVAEEVRKCQESSRPACLYQLQRALADVVLTQPDLGFEQLMYLSADAIAAGEQFLTYKDRNIGDGERLEMNAEDIALLNGKLYWTLADDLESLKSFAMYREYLNCLYMAGLKCIQQGRAQTTEEDLQYAKLTYYMGNFEERILRLIPKESESTLYKNMGENSMRHYTQAAQLLENRPGYYAVETNMERNIQQGIRTLRELGF